MTNFASANTFDDCEQVTIDGEKWGRVSISKRWKRCSIPHGSIRLRCWSDVAYRVGYGYGWGGYMECEPVAVFEMGCAGQQHEAAFFRTSTAKRGYLYFQFHCLF